MPATKKQQAFGSGVVVVRHVEIAVENENDFYSLCVERDRMIADKVTDPKAWLSLADRFQKAKGTGVSHMAEWCRKQADLCKRVPKYKPALLT
jgi:hypothetical protein